MYCFRSRKFIWPKAAKRVFIVFFLLFTAHLSLFTVTQAQEARPFLTDKDQYNYAMFLYKQGHYTVAAREFGRTIEYFPGSPVIPQAQYMIGDAYLNAAMYHDAANQFQQFIKNFPDNELKTEASLKLEVAQAKVKHVPAGFKQGEAALLSIPKLPVVKAPPSIFLKTEGAMRAVQIALFEGKNYKEVENELERLKVAGIDTIILRVFHNKDDRFYSFIKPKNKVGVYFETKYSPVVEDILGPVLNIAHKKGLRVFAWMTTRYADYGLETRKDLSCKAYDFSTKDIVSCRGLDLFNEDAVNHLERIFDDLARYPIDGILFQDDLVLKHNEGFGSFSQRLFEKENGIKLAPAGLYNGVSENGKGGYYVAQYTAEFWRWSSWKNKRLLEVAVRLKAKVKKRNPHVKFAINLMYESISNPPYALAWLSQSMDEAIKQGFDYYAVMAYHRQMQDELKKGPFEINKLIADMTVESVKLIGEPEKVLIKLQTIDWNTSRPLANEDVVRLLKKVKGISNVSLALVPYIKDFPFEELGGHAKRDYALLSGGGQKKVTQLVEK